MVKVVSASRIDKGTGGVGGEDGVGVMGELCGEVARLVRWVGNKRKGADEIGVELGDEVKEGLRGLDAGGVVKTADGGGYIEGVGGG